MEIKDYIDRIKRAIVEKESYDDYVQIFEEYKDFLEKRIFKNPKDIIARSQLAAVFMELRMDSDFSKDIMEEALVNYESELSVDEKTRLYTNLAFFYEENYSTEGCMDYLIKAINLNPQTPNAYDVLGRFYADQGNYREAVSLFETAQALSEVMKYHYNYAVALHQNGEVLKAKVVFEKLYQNYPTDTKVMFGFGVCCFETDDLIEALAMANKLAKLSELDDSISEFQIADLFYLCDEFASHNAMFDTTKYYENASWLGAYFYCLNILGKKEQLSLKFSEVISRKEKDILEAMNDELDENFTFEDREEVVASYSTEKKDIETTYFKVTNENFKPMPKLELYFMYGCYLLDCPRHQ